MPMSEAYVMHLERVLFDMFSLEFSKNKENIQRNFYLSKSIRTSEMTSFQAKQRSRNDLILAKNHTLS